MNAVSAIEAAVFSEDARTAFAAAYPDRATKLGHGLAGHALLTLEALAGLAERMPADRVEYNLGKLPLGVRPEDVQPRSEGQFVGLVGLIEPLGVETLVHIKAGEQTLVSIVPGMTSLRIGNEVRFNIVRERLHFFKPDGERMIS